MDDSDEEQEQQQSVTLVNSHTNKPIGEELFIRRVCIWTCIGTVIAAFGTMATAPIFISFLSDEDTDKTVQICMYFSIGLVGTFVMRKIVLLDEPTMNIGDHGGLEATNAISRCIYWAIYFFFMGICVVPLGIAVSLVDIRIMLVLQALNLVVQLSFIIYCLLRKTSHFILMWGLPMLCGALGTIALGVSVMMIGIHEYVEMPIYLTLIYLLGVIMFMVMLSAYVRQCCYVYETGQPDHLYICMTFWTSPIDVFWRSASVIIAWCVLLSRLRMEKRRRPMPSRRTTTAEDDVVVV